VLRPLIRALDRQESAELREYAAEAIGNSKDGVNTVVPELIEVLLSDRDATVRQHLALAMHYVRDFEKSDAAKALEKILDETGRDMKLVRYDAARVLAHLLQDRSPGKAVEVLTEMLKDTGLKEYNGTDSTLNKGNESMKSGTGAEEKLGLDARYMGAVALTYVARGGKRKDATDALNKDAIDILKEAAESSDPARRRVAAAALKSIGPP
jgi:HEAT repeat protein